MTKSVVYIGVLVVVVGLQVAGCATNAWGMNTLGHKELAGIVGSWEKGGCEERPGCAENDCEGEPPCDPPSSTEEVHQWSIKIGGEESVEETWIMICITYTCENFEGQCGVNKSNVTGTTWKWDCEYKFKRKGTESYLGYVHEKVKGSFMFALPDNVV